MLGPQEEEEIKEDWWLGRCPLGVADTIDNIQGARLRVFLAPGNEGPHTMFLRPQMSIPHLPFNTKDRVLWKINLIYNGYRTCLCGGQLRGCVDLKRNRGLSPLGLNKYLVL